MVRSTTVTMKAPDYNCEVLHIQCSDAHCLTYHLDGLKHDEANRKSWGRRKLNTVLGAGYRPGLDNPRGACLLCPRAQAIHARFVLDLAALGVKTPLNVMAYRELCYARKSGGSFKAVSKGKIKAGQGWHRQGHAALISSGCLLLTSGRVFVLTPKGEEVLAVLERYFGCSD